MPVTPPKCQMHLQGVSKIRSVSIPFGFLLAKLKRSQCFQLLYWATSLCLTSRCYTMFFVCFCLPTTVVPGSTGRIWIACKKPTRPPRPTSALGFFQCTLPMSPKVFSLTWQGPKSAALTKIGAMDAVDTGQEMSISTYGDYRFPRLLFGARLK